MVYVYSEPVPYIHSVTLSTGEIHPTADRFVLDGRKNTVAYFRSSPWRPEGKYKLNSVKLVLYCLDPVENDNRDVECLQTLASIDSNIDIIPYDASEVVSHFTFQTGSALKALDCTRLFQNWQEQEVQGLMLRCHNHNTKITFAGTCSYLYRPFWYFEYEGQVPPKHPPYLGLLRPFPEETVTFCGSWYPVLSWKLPDFFTKRILKSYQLQAEVTAVGPKHSSFMWVSNIRSQEGIVELTDQTFKPHVPGRYWVFAKVKEASLYDCGYFDVVMKENK